MLVQMKERSAAKTRQVASNMSVWFLQKAAYVHIGEQFKSDAIFRRLHIFTHCRR